MVIDVGQEDFEAQLCKVAGLRGSGHTLRAHHAAVELLQSLHGRESNEVDDALREKVARIYNDPPSDWARPYTFPRRDVVLALESMAGTPDLAALLESQADVLRLRGHAERAMLFMVAAASVYAEFGAAGSSRQFLLDTLARVAFELQRFDVALAASQTRLALTEPSDHFFVTLCERLIGTSLLRLGRREEAVPFLERVIATRRALAQRGVGPTGWVDEAERWLSMATIDDSQASSDDPADRGPGSSPPASS